ncbi:DUF115 domain-containing protein [Luteolibacter yonseiensis]|uniref:DUF115 domain-containing protein n=1 Tax=Luteolibacter yonseiensis TaxID=1144680 RepID=A0A934R704_9BACT|nr:6-hydroxymethylpterin diphosphokinase MptE-like protein [Luteolibacter yonseiensis]MBK1817123.1 DUF115 domain-containing protein [Luteolibacter yonseiensis]
MVKFTRKVLGRLFRAVFKKPDKEGRRVRSSLAFFESLRNKHAGKPGFVIGNGPSLRVEDLDRLKGIVSIASNKVYLAFDQTAWRPDYYTVADPLIWEKVRSVVGRFVQAVIIPTYLDAPTRGAKHIKTFRYLGNAAVSPPAEGIAFSRDFTKGAYGGYTVTYENLQLAVYLGLNPIYVIGCDHYYMGEDSVEAEQVIAVGEKSNHFIPNYWEKGEVVHVAPIKEMTKSYQTAQRFAAENNIQIINATRGGHLEAFPRGDLDEILAQLESR